MVDQVDVEPEPVVQISRDTFGTTSAIVQDVMAAQDIHDSNMKFIEQMTQGEMKEEKMKLLESLSKFIIIL